VRPESCGNLNGSKARKDEGKTKTKTKKTKKKQLQKIKSEREKKKKRGGLGKVWGKSKNRPRSGTKGEEKKKNTKETKRREKKKAHWCSKHANKNCREKGSREKTQWDESKVKKLMNRRTVTTVWGGKGRNYSGGW